MPIRSLLSISSDEFQTRHQEMSLKIDQFRDLESAVVAHSNRAAKKFSKRGQLLPRQRIEHLLDKGSHFLELSTLAGYNMHDDDGKKTIAGGGNIIGIGFISGVRCLITANDSAIKGGSISPMGLKKTLRAQQIALENKLPVVSLVESGGANLLYQAELFVDGGKSFCNMARLSAAGIPQITVVHGSSTAGGAYIPGLSDYVIVVKDQAKIYLAGPPLVKAALGEDADHEELGGAMMHSTITGTAEYLAEDDAHGIHLARQVVAQLGWNDELRQERFTDFKEPLYSVDEILGVVPCDFKTPYDVREVIGRIVDGSEFLEFKALYGPQTVCGHARIHGMKCGIIGNNGPIFSAGANKATHFIQACNQSNTPLIYLHNIAGYMVGKEAEQSGIVKNGARMIQAVSNSAVPQISILIGGSFGAGNYGMCGRAYDPRFIFAWPNARISVMGGEQAAKVMEIVLMNQLKRLFATMSITGDDVAKVANILRSDTEHWPKMIEEYGLPIKPDGLMFFAMNLAPKLQQMGIVVDVQSKKGILAQLADALIGQFDRESTALYATARIWDDGIIDPRDTRQILALCLQTCREATQRTLYPNSYGIPR